MSSRWMAEIAYRNGRPLKVLQFEEIADLHDIVEMGPDWNEIEQIVITLNLSSAKPAPEPPPARTDIPVTSE